MCYDISYTTDIEYLEEYFPEVVIEDWIDIDFSITVHRMAHSFLPHPVLINEDGCIRLKYFEWGLIASYMNSADKIKSSGHLCAMHVLKKFLKIRTGTEYENKGALFPLPEFMSTAKFQKRKFHII